MKSSVKKIVFRIFKASFYRYA